ncbi:Hypothetical predicted protein, partial [Paramuricea clavata]
NHLECVGAELRQTFVSRVKEAGVYVIKNPQKTTDISAVEQLSLFLRYYDCNEKTIWEDSVCFLDVLDKEYGSNPGNPGEVVVKQDSIPMTMDNFLQRCEEDNHWETYWK